MDQERLFAHFDKRYVSKREMLTRTPLGMQADALWQQLLNRRRARSTTLPLRNSAGVPYWFCTTEKMIAASEKIVEALYENDTVLDPYTEMPTVSTLEEVFFTSFVEGSKMDLRAAMEFLQSDKPPMDVEEQLIANNRMAGTYAGQYLFRPVDEAFLQDLAYILTEGIEGGGHDYRTEDAVEIPSMQGEPYNVPQAGAVSEKVQELLAYLSDPTVHPLIKAGIAQAWMLIVRPFPDGNERLGRLLSSVILLRAGYTFFSEISLSALIARRGYGYYESVANILREENGGDLTFFLDFFLELLAYAVDERARRISQRKDETLEAEARMARMPLATAVDPTFESELQPPPPAATDTGPPKPTVDPYTGVEGGDDERLALLSSRTGIDADVIRDMKRRLWLYANRCKNPANSAAIRRLTELLDEGRIEFTISDLKEDPALRVPVMRGLLGDLNDAELVGFRLYQNKKVYGFNFDRAGSGSMSYTTESERETVTEISEAAKEEMKYRLLLFAETIKGTVTPNAAKRLIEYIDQGKYVFTSRDLSDDFGLTHKQRDDLILFLKENGLVERLEGDYKKPYPHRFCFLSDTLSESDYAPEIMGRLRELSGPDTTPRDSRLYEILTACLPKGTISKEDYLQRGLTEQTWYKDKVYAQQLGLTEAISPGVSRICRELAPGLPELTKSQKAIVTATYESFGASPFSVKMFQARIDYSEASAYTCLHQLTMLRIMECRKEDLKFYQLLVNPQDNPECFTAA